MQTTIDVDFIFPQMYAGAIQNVPIPDLGSMDDMDHIQF